MRRTRVTAGVYAGDGSQPEVKERMEASDLILTIGAIKASIQSNQLKQRGL